MRLSCAAEAEPLRGSFRQPLFSRNCWSVGSGLSLSRMQLGLLSMIRAAPRALSEKRIRFGCLDRLVMFGKVETQALAFFGYPERDEKSDKLQNEEGYCAAPRCNDCHVV